MLVRSYVPSREIATLNCPITAIFPNNDVISRDNYPLSAWVHHTSSAFSLSTIDGTHMYFVNPPSAFLRLLSKPVCSEWMGDGTYELVSLHAGTPDMNTQPFGR